MYGVETILDKKIDPTTNDSKYLVKWEGFGLEQSSWEPYKHLKDDCEDIVQEFEEQNGMFITTELGKIFIPNIDPETVRKVKESMGRTNGNNLKKQEQIQNSKSQSIIPKTPKKNVETIKQNKRIRKSAHKLKETPQQSSSQSLQEQELQQKNNGYQNRRLRVKPENKTKLNRNYRRSKHFVDHNQMTRQSYFEQEQKKNSQRAVELSYQQQDEKIENKSENVHQQTHQIKSSFRPIIIHNVESQKYLKSVEEDPKSKDPYEHMFGKQQKLEIIGMRRTKIGFEFYVGYFDGKKNWLSHNYVFNNHSKQLCRFYEKNMTLD